MSEGRPVWFPAGIVSLTTVLSVVLLAVLSGVLMGALVASVQWFRWEGRVEYRSDRRTLHRLEQRWRRVRRRLTIEQRRQAESVMRRLDQRLRVSRQALRARRRTTTFWRYVCIPATRIPYRLDVPFERDFLVEVEVLLDEIGVPTPAREARPRVLRTGPVRSTEVA